MNHKQSMETEIPAIEQVTSTVLDAQQVQGIDLVHLAVGDVNERGNRAAYALRKKSLAWFMAVLCVKTQKTMSQGVDFQIETRLKCQKNQGESLTYEILN
jgi:hypothetical protein